MFGVGTVSSQGHDAFELMSKSTDGGTSWSKGAPVAGPVTQPGTDDPALGRPVIDGAAGARSDLAPAPSVDIANGAPTGADATNRIVMTYVSGDLAKPHVYFTESTDGGTNWLTPRVIEGVVDRGLLHRASDLAERHGRVRRLQRVHDAVPADDRDAAVARRGRAARDRRRDRAHGRVQRDPPGAPGDPRGSSQNNLVAEFLGDYVYAAATRTYGAAVWNDTRNAADCPAIDAYRQALENGQTAATAPDVQQQCPATFGNSDIWAFTTAP